MTNTDKLLDLVTGLQEQQERMEVMMKELIQVQMLTLTLMAPHLPDEVNQELRETVDRFKAFYDN